MLSSIKIQTTLINKKGLLMICTPFFIHKALIQSVPIDLSDILRASLALDASDSKVFHNESSKIVHLQKEVNFLESYTFHTSLGSLKA